MNGDDEQAGRSPDDDRAQRTDLVPAPGRAPVETQSASRAIVVNGRRFRVRGDDVSHDQIVQLVYPELKPRDSQALTVAYRGGPLRATDGLLTPYQRVPIADEETFVVAHTSAS